MKQKWDKNRWIIEPKLKWSKEFSERELKYFNKKISKEEKVNDWGWWALFVVLVIMIIMFILKVR